MPAHLLDDSLADIAARLETWGEPAYRARQIARWALREGVTSFDAMTDLPCALRTRLAHAYTLEPPSELARTAADDGSTTKVLLGLGEPAPGAPSFAVGDAVEAVRMDYDPDRPEHATGTRRRATVCVSTQAGCAMGCVFCATGQQGFTRNLTTAEILAQVLHFTRGNPESGVSNVVFMGMGEPLANYEPTLRAVRWLIDPHGLDMRARGVTISTVGLEGPIRRLASEGLQIGLTVSLHAPDDELRRQLIPTAGGVTLDGLIDASREYVDRTGRRVTFAYALLEGVNDEPEQARRLAARVRGMRAHVNLIPYNPTAGEGLRRPSTARVRAFQRELQAAGINATVRIERGVEIAAACGQLRTDVALGDAPQPLAVVEPGTG
ncbi:MAG: 23S rRNA (adenine(2503)-C(2))-methyltransferase RlmN [Chloroflexi bacterium]|nr:23S rRNA (adenine(2503)-C(2))-methyltransferase RlmN [Chloroflexota bacterium]